MVVETLTTSSPEDRTSKESIPRFNNRLSQARKAGEGLAALQEDGYFPLNLRGEVDSLVERIRALVQFIENPDAAPDIREIAANETEKSQPFVPIA